MRDSREILRLKATGLSHRQVAAAVNRSPSVVSECLARFRAAGLSWPLPPEFDNSDALEARLYRGHSNPPTDRSQPDWRYVNREMRRKSVTLMLLWEEYRKEHPDGFQYSWFCERYHGYRRHLDPVMRQEHLFGEKCFTDYAGPTVPIIVNAVTGEVRRASIFVGVLGASNFTYAEATWSQSLPCWLRSHIRMFGYWGGVPAIEVPDNLKAAVRGADTYEPMLNQTFYEFSEHYHYAIMPARKRKPRDKAKVENAVLIVERWILAALRHRTFHSLEELNEAIAELLEKLNDRPFRKLKGSRRSIFEQYERPQLQALPSTPYIVGVWRKATVNIDYHVEVDDHFYSVPYRLIGEKLEIRLTDGTLEVYHRETRVAAHIRSFYKGKHTTLAEHMPPKHRHHAQWTPERLVAWAQKTGPATAAMVDNIMKGRQHPQQGFRACLGVLRLGEKFGADRLEQACRRATKAGAYSYRHVRSILERNLDRQPDPEVSADCPARPTTHENLRGAAYWANWN